MDWLKCHGSKNKIEREVERKTEKTHVRFCGMEGDKIIQREEVIEKIFVKS